ncbi:hypothetical protein BB559_003428 [Furculomyces boomerangus]|uniref:Uncharacterized protein n=2 Tax=Harpellales TaxID=61421 RepID=A0A2T9YLG2_9FUNG|nr:hypothetical protein BB559_003428 [Furculomyces boomerangus]PVZ99461.1 hypothetical protein BB558_004433 [Smittium angustum]
MIKVIDIGANLTDPVFKGVYHKTHAHQGMTSIPDDFSDVIKRAKAVGMSAMMVTGGSLHESRKAIKLAKEDDCLYATVGCHPTRVKEFETTLDKSTNSPNPEKYYNDLLKTIEEGGDKVVAVGECGLDYDRTHFASIEIQKKYFELQFNLAETTKLPMFLHNRNTNGDFVEIVRKNRDKFSTGVVHSFTSSMEEMLQCVELGLYIGINGCSLKTEENVNVAKAIPDDKLMIETDCPYCDIKRTHASYKYLEESINNQAKQEENGINSNGEWWLAPKQKVKNRWTQDFMVKGRNEPCTIRQVLRVLAKIRNQDEQYLADVIYKNTTKVFFPNKQL